MAASVSCFLWTFGSMCTSTRQHRSAGHFPRIKQNKAVDSRTEKCYIILYGSGVRNPAGNGGRIWQNE